MNYVRDTDRGASYLMRQAAAMANRVKLSVGVPANAGSYPNGTPVAVVGAAHEFGLGNMPQRSFIRGWYDGHGNSYFGYQITHMAQNALLHGTPFRVALDAFGAKCVKEIQARMDANIPPPLQERTVARKRAHGSATPEIALEDTGLLRASIKAEVEE